jgi:hypothetical protein
MPLAAAGPLLDRVSNTSLGVPMGTFPKTPVAGESASVAPPRPPEAGAPAAPAVPELVPAAPLDPPEPPDPGAPAPPPATPPEPEEPAVPPAPLLPPFPADPPEPASPPAPPPPAPPDALPPVPADPPVLPPNPPSGVTIRGDPHPPPNTSSSAATSPRGYRSDRAGPQPSLPDAMLGRNDTIIRGAEKRRSLAEQQARGSARVGQGRATPCPLSAGIRIWSTVLQRCSKRVT